MRKETPAAFPEAQMSSQVAAGAAASLVALRPVGALVAAAQTERTDAHRSLAA